MIILICFTGDLVTMDEEGYIYFNDRTGDTFRYYYVGLVSYSATQICSIHFSGLYFNYSRWVKVEQVLLWLNEKTIQKSYVCARSTKYWDLFNFLTTTTPMTALEAYSKYLLLNLSQTSEQYFFSYVNHGGKAYS